MKMHAMKVLSGMLLVSGAAAMATEIGYINMQKAASEYHVALEKSEVFFTNRTKIVEDYNARVKELQLVKVKIASMQQLSNETIDPVKRQPYIEATREFQLKGLKLEAELKEYGAQQDAVIKKALTDLNVEVFKDVDAKLAEFAKAQKLDAVADVSGRAYPYYDKTKDITEPFLAKINAGKEDYVKKTLEKRKKEAEKTPEATASGLSAAEALLNKSEEEKKAAAAAAEAAAKQPK